MTIFCPNGHPNPDPNRFCQSCGTGIVQPTPSLETTIQTISNEMTSGIMLGDRYRIQREIGQGGFGRTYLCEDVNRLNELCVLKEFAPQAQGTALLNKAQELFEREAGVMYRLQHPQIPRFREMFRSNRHGVGQLFLVQDYIGGETYQQLLRQKLQQGRRFSETEIIEFLTKILPVLSYIHSLGVIHRDISPDNLIKRTMDGLPVLIDFGGVKQVAVNLATQYLPTNEHNHHNMATRLGKIGYAPSEQMQRGIVSPQSDLYALSATSLVLLTGLEPADLIDPQNFGWNWREHVRLTPQLNSVFDRMLQFRPSDRFSSAEDVLEALSSKTFGNFAPTISAPPPAPIVPPAPVIEPIAPPQTVVVAPRPYQPPQPQRTDFNPPPPEAGLGDVLGKTWLIILSCAAALGLGWGFASLTGKNVSNSPLFDSESIPIASPTPTQTISPTPTVSPTISPPPSPISIDALKPLFPAALASRGINADLYGNIIKQIFTIQNPNIRFIPVDDNKVQSQLDSISTDFGSKLSSYLSGSAIGKIGSYSVADRANWRSQVNGLNLSERALMDLTDAKYRSITDLSAQKLGLSFDEFVSTPIGQVYLAAMSDRVSAIQDRRAIGSISIALGSSSGIVKGTLQPGEGKAFLSNLVGGQDISVKVNTTQPTKLSIYPPSSKFPAMLESAPTSNWFGKTMMNGAHEFVLVSQSDLPIQYEITLTAVDLNPVKSNEKLSPSPISPPQY
jgi:serine/threonine protein kinase, bacterial